MRGFKSLEDGFVEPRVWGKGERKTPSLSLSVVTLSVTDFVTLDVMCGVTYDVTQFVTSRV